MPLSNKPISGRLCSASVYGALVKVRGFNVKRTLFLFSTACLTVSPVQADSLDGKWKSDVGNTLAVRGSTATYRGYLSSDYGNEVWSITPLGRNRYRVNSYECDHSGNTLTCGGGRRIWTRYER
jgi:hypothetical protein